jgi:hypothetical protein
MADLARLTREALERAMGDAGWPRCTWPPGDEAYERQAAAPFVLRAEFWIEDSVEAMVSVFSPALDQALSQLGEGDVDAWVARDPLDEPVTIESPDQVEEVVADLVRRVDAAAERLRAYADVDAFAEAIAADEDMREGAPIAVPVLLTVVGRKREAHERAELAARDLDDRLRRWMRGERPPPPPGFEDRFNWSAALKESIRKTRERRATSGAERPERPQASWDDLARTGRSVLGLLRGKLPPSTIFPARDGAWEPVELRSDAEPVLEKARERSPLALPQGAIIEARIEWATPGQLRVLVDGTDVGNIAARGGAGESTVSAKVERTRRDAPLSLAIQLPAGR